MSWWQRVRAALRASVENPSVNLADASGSWMDDWASGGAQSESGVRVSPMSAMQLSAVYACVRLLAENVASLPIVTYRRSSDGGRKRDTRHFVHTLLHDQPNDLQSAFSFFEAGQGVLALMGNAVTEIIRDGGGRPRELWPLEECTIDADLKRRKMFYRINGRKPLLPADVIHVPGFGFDGLVGKSPIEHARESFAMALAAERYGARFFRNSAIPSGVLETEKNLTKEQIDLLQQTWEQSHSAATRGTSRKTAIVFGGLKWRDITVNPEDAQFLETRKFHVSDIARIFRIPPHMIGDVERSTSWGTGIEQQNLGFLTYTLRPWLVRWERELNRKLFDETERQQYFVEFLVDGLLRSDLSSRSESYATAITNGWMSRNEVRRLENLNPVDGLDEFLVPLNMGGGQDAQPDPGNGDGNAE